MPEPITITFVTWVPEDDSVAITRDLLGEADGDDR
jgi:hypothetical protein